MILKSAAKLNLTLDVLGILPGGFHAIETIFHSVSLHDSMHFHFTQQNSEQLIQQKILVSLALETSGSEHKGEETIDFPLHSNNLIARAAELFSSSTGLGKDLAMLVTVNKNIPIAAGLAGGSGNAAATLLALNTYFNNKLSQLELCELSAKLGSDIGFFIYGGTCIGRHRGELIETVASELIMHFLIVKPRDIAISTPWIYKTFDQYLDDGRIEKRESKLRECVEALQLGNLFGVADAVGNDFEPVVYNEHSIVQNIQQRMLELGCLNANVSGSGPTLYGLVDSKESGEKIKESLLKSVFQNQHVKNQPSKLDFNLDYNGADIFDVWVVHSTKHAIEIITEQNL